jgi:rhodanese-related sulfurtransferase
MALQHSPAFLALVQEAKSRIQECSVDQVRQRQLQGESITLIDVREESEWQAGRIVGSIHLGKGIIERDIEVRFPDPNTELILYCGGGFRSVLAADNLQKMGYTRVISMEGGIRSWREAVYPLE